MIFVTVGTQDKPFKRLLETIENSGIEEEIIIQAGFTAFESKKYTVFSYIDKNQFDEYMEKADVIITHGGVGTIMKALSLKKKVIACARLSKYGEHQNDHQLQLIEPFSSKGYILELKEGDDLKEVLEKAKTFEGKEIKLNNENFVNRLENTLKSF